MSLWSAITDFVLGPYAEDRQLVNGGNINLALDFYDTYYETLGNANVAETAAVEFGLGVIGRSFLVADVDGVDLGPLTMSMLARQTIALGNAVFVINVSRRLSRDGEVRLMPVADFKIDGDPDPDSWRYTVRLQRPNSEQPIPTDELPVRTYPAEGIVHVRYMPGPSAPWHGVSPLIRAGMTADQLARIEKSLAYDAGVPTGGLLPLPNAVSPVGLEAAKAAITNGKGKTTLVETTAAGWGAGAQSAPRGDWEQRRFGPQTPESSIALRDSTFNAVLSAMGIPPALYTSQGAALRESYRQLFSDTILPLGALIAAELTEKLETEVTIRFPEAFKTDISARSRGYSSLIQSGMMPADAARVTGLPPGLRQKPEPAPVQDPSNTGAGPGGPPTPAPQSQNGVNPQNGRFVRAV